MIQIAYADAAAATTTGGMGSTILMIVLMIAIFYFLMIRPENKRKKQAEEMRSSLKKGDWLTTIGGVYGRVVAITDRTVVIETSEDRVRVEFLKSAIGQVGTLDEQAAAQQRPAKKAKKEEAAEETPAVEEMTSPRLPLRLTKPTPSNTDREERCPEGGALFALTAISTGVSCDADLPHKLKQS